MASGAIPRGEYTPQAVPLRAGSVPCCAGPSCRVLFGSGGSFARGRGGAGFPVRLCWSPWLAVPRSWSRRSRPLVRAACRLLRRRAFCGSWSFGRCFLGSAFSARFATPPAAFPVFFRLSLQGSSLVILSHTHYNIFRPKRGIVTNKSAHFRKSSLKNDRKSNKELWLQQQKEQ